MISNDEPFIISIVMPVYNNARHIDELVERTRVACESCVGDRYEIILVDDGSKDESWQSITRLADSNVIGIKLSRNFGQHPALKAGFSAARSKYVIMLDADLEDRPEVIPEIYAKLLDGYDICFTEFSEESAYRQRLTSKFFHAFVGRLATTSTGKNVGTMRGFNRRVVEAILSYGERKPIYGPLITGLGFHTTTITIEHGQRKANQSSYSLGRRLRLASDFLIGYTNVVSGFFLVASGVAFLATILYMAIIIVQYLLFGSSLPSGLSLIMVLMLVLFSVLFLGVAIMGLYLHRLLEESLDRPLYVIQTTTNTDWMDTENIRRLSYVRRD